MLKPRTLLVLMFAGCDTQLSESDFSLVDFDEGEALPEEALQPTPELRDSQMVVGGDLVASMVRDVLYVANTDVNSISRYEPETAAFTELEILGGPTQLATHGDAVYASLRANGSIAVLTDDGDAFQLIEEVEVGAEPTGLVLSADGERLYVALTVDDQVLEMDTATMAVVRRWDVPDGPRWLTRLPTGDGLYVSSVFRGGLHRIDLDAGTVNMAVLPDIGVIGSLSMDFEDVDRTRVVPRITGDAAVSPEGDAMAIPLLLVNPGGDEQDRENEGAYGGGEEGIPGTAPMTPVLLVAPLRGGYLQMADAELIGISGVASGREPMQFNSFLSEVMFSADGQSLIVPIEGSDVVVAVSRDTPLYDAPLQTEERFIRLHPMAAMTVLNGPKSIAQRANGELVAYSFLDRDVLNIQSSVFPPLLEQNRKVVAEAGELFLMEGDQIGAPEILWLDYRAAPVNTDTLQYHPVSARTLHNDLEDGRRLFFSAADTRMSDASSVSCSTCHFEGRNDGVTWSLEHGARQTPSLSGGISATAPFTWTGTVNTVADEARITSRTRMGGSGLTITEASNIASYVDAIRRISPVSDLDAGAIARGRDLFAVTGCLSCHRGPAFTDNQSYVLNNPSGDAVNTPSLLGIARTAPYFHDGSAQTLRDLLEQSRDGSMGDTANLTDAQMDDLETYLRSL
ncbi:MAG: cytochrome c peroxidase [Myxococcota bacterium]